MIRKLKVVTDCVEETGCIVMLAFRGARGRADTAGVECCQ